MSLNPFANQSANSNRYGGISGSKEDLEALNQGFQKMEEEPVKKDAFYSSREARIAALKRRENEIQMKENELRTREEMLAKGVGYGAPKNWPCSCYPIARHNIRADIPVEFQKVTLKFYYLWLLNFLCLCWNWLCIFMWWCWPDTSPDDKTMVFLLSSLYVGAGIPFSFLWWYKRFYDAMRTQSMLTFSHFTNLAIHVLFVGFCVLGAPECGTAGVINMAKIFAHHAAGLGICFLIAVFMWSGNLMISIYLYRESSFLYGLKQVEERLGRKIKIDKNGELSI